LIAEDRPRAMNGTPPAVTDLELQLLLEAVQRVSGHDFREYAPATLRRRVLERVRSEGATTISGLQERVLHEPGSMERFVDALTHNASAPFADPAFLTEFLTHILPRLRTFPHVRVWIAGCGAGDDAYAIAALCKEADFLERIRIYATDASELATERARAGIIPRAGAAASRNISSPRVSSCAMRRTCARASCSRSTTWPPTVRSTSST
jgi:chemotaxis protein methyltransferase CheR